VYKLYFQATTIIHVGSIITFGGTCLAKPGGNKNNRIFYKQSGDRGLSTVPHPFSNF
jgi:hypothetical protein